MKLLMTYQNYVTEELRVLKGPSNDDIYEMLKKLSPDEMFNTISNTNLGDEYLQFALDQVKEYSPVYILGLIRKYCLGDRGFQAAVDKGILNSLTPNHILSYASESGSLKYVQYALEHGADINYKNERGQTALHFASKYGFIDIVKYLIAHHADIDVKDNAGWSALFLAISWGKLEVVKFLIQHGTDVNETHPTMGFTPLIYAAWSSRYQIVKFLVESGADVLKKDGMGRTAFDIARKGSRIAIYLQKKMSG